MFECVLGADWSVIQTRYKLNLYMLLASVLSSLAMPGVRGRTK